MRSPSSAGSSTHPAGDADGPPDGADAGRAGLRSMGLFRRLGWGVADQGISSLGNLVLGLLVARSLGPEGFGAFSLAFVTFGFVLAASRGPSTDPLLVRFSGVQPSAWRQAVAASTATALVSGVIAGLGCIAVGLALPSTVGAGLVALGFGLPGILLQDSYRFAWFAQGRGDKAFVNDLVWAVLQIGAVLALVATGRATDVTCVLAFGGTATLAALVGLAQSRIRPQLRRVRAWLVDHRDLGGRYLAENVSVGGARQVRMFAVGAIAGLTAVGEIRAAEILMGPFLVLLSGVSQVAIPEAGHVLDRAPERLERFCLWLGLVPAVAATAWGVAVYVILPQGPGELLLADLWKPAWSLLVPMTAVLVTGCFLNAAAAGVRALGASRRSLAAQLSNAALYLVCGSLGAAVDGAAGSTWGLVLAGVVGCVIWRYELRMALTEHCAALGHEPIAGRESS
ncbi:hypothetical protein GCM10009844_14990 [Nocardioides koreensis]|uniref:O-antigen/teichoic acid export membrane protein n=1 Tax=Nocardioides koreensis TaxID=433651 RepID=A0ABN2ZJJ3_9ACTN